MSVTELSPDVLLVEDNPGDAQLVNHYLNTSEVTDIAGDVTLSHFESLSDGLAALDQASYDILFLDLGLPESTGLTTLERALEEVPRMPIVVLTGLDNREIAIQSIQRGAQDYLPKEDLDADTLARSLRYAVERHQQEEKLREQNERLDKFASVVSHDLRNPLNVAQGRLQLAQKEIDGKSEHLDVAAQAHDRMEALIEDLLTLARDETMDPDVEPVDLPGLVRDCWQTIDTTEAALVAETERTIRADRSRLRQLIENLIRNAIEHGGEGVTITIGDIDDGFYVADDGPGIPPEKRETVFETGQTTSAHGTGFGLAIVNRIVESHGWEISVTTSAANGAQFEITGLEALS